MKKKILLIILVAILIGGSFVIGRQVWLNTEDSKTRTIITDITKTKAIPEYNLKD